MFSTVEHILHMHRSSGSATALLGAVLPGTPPRYVRWLHVCPGVNVFKPSFTAVFIPHPGDFGLVKLLLGKYYVTNRSGSGTVTHLAPELFEVKTAFVALQQLIDW